MPQNDVDDPGATSVDSETESDSDIYSDCIYFVESDSKSDNGSSDRLDLQPFWGRHFIK